MRIRILTILIALASCGTPDETVVNTVKFSAAESKKLILPNETHFKSLKQLTTNGENAEAYFDHSFTKLIFQAKRDGREYDAIYEMDLNGENLQMLSNGVGVTTCSYFMPDGKSFIYASTHGGQRSLERPADVRGYVWQLHADFDIYLAEYPSKKIIKKLTVEDRYDAEATISPNGDKILFTSIRSGDMEIYVMDIDGSNVKRLTNMPGFDGGPFFNWDGTQIVWRGSHPTDSMSLKQQMDLQARDLMTPVALDIYVMDADGRNIKRITDNGAANFGPFFHPDNKRIIFSSNYNSPSGRTFNLWMIDNTGENLKQITHGGVFNGFPMFSKDGKLLVFASNRNNAEGSRDTNVFIAEWQD